MKYIIEKQQQIKSALVDFVLIKGPELFIAIYG